MFLLHLLLFLLTSPGLLAIDQAQGDTPTASEEFIDKPMQKVHNNYSTCFTENIMWMDEMSGSIVNVTSADDCQQLCVQNKQKCSFFSWSGPFSSPYRNMCWLYQYNTKPTESIGSISGPMSCTCSTEHTCMLHADLIVGIIEPVDNEVECQYDCRYEEACHFYSWFDSKGVVFKDQCILLSSCEKSNVTLEGCHSGPETCDFETPLDWYGDFSTQNYPKNYTSRYNNSWILTTSKASEKILLFIVDFATSSDHILTVTDDDGTELLSHSGNNMPNSTLILSKSNLININFYPLSGVTNRGFEIKWKIIDHGMSNISSEPETVLAKDDNIMCWTNNQTWVDSMSETVTDVHSAHDCQEICKQKQVSGNYSYNYCSHFTWFSSSAPSYKMMCMLYPGPETSNPTNCTHCVSGNRTCVCSTDKTCSLYNDVIVDIREPIYYEMVCQEWCRRIPECTFYSWFDSTGELFQDTCLLLTTCLPSPASLQGCHSGPQTCDGVQEVLPLAPANTITSPNYPSNYPLNQNINWIITTAKSSQKLEINFEHFNTEDCCDQVTITDKDGTVIMQHGGPNMPSPATVTSKTDSVTINFRSDPSNVFKGFLLKWRVVV